MPGIDELTMWPTALGAVASVATFQALGAVAWAFFRTSMKGSHTRGGCDPLLVLFFQQVLGMGSAMVALLLLAVFGIFNWWSIALLSGSAMFAALAWPGAGFKWSAPPWGRRGGVGWWEWAILACAVMMMTLQSWRFPAAWDDTSYHLPLARTILEHHGLVANEWLRFPYFPAFMHLLFAVGLMVDFTLAPWLASWPVCVALLGLMGAARWLWKHSAWGVLAWAMYVNSPALLHSLGFAYVDAALVLFCMAAVLALTLWVAAKGSDAIGWLVLAGCFAGIAGGIKFQGVVIAAMLGAAVFVVGVWRGAIVRTLFAYGLPCLAICSFWYVRSFLVTGDPIHPAGGAVFGYYGWTAQDLALQIREQASHGVPKHWGHFLSALWNVRLPYFYLALAWPLVLLSRSRVQWTWVLFAFITWAGTLFWFWVSQVDRYLLPIVPIGALLAIEVMRCVAVVSGVAGSLRHVVGKRVLAAGAVVCAVYMLTSAGSAWLQRPSISAQSDEHPEIALLATADALASQYGRRVLNLGYENAFFYFSGQLVGDWFGLAAFPRIAECDPECRLKSPEETAQSMQRLGARMLLIHSDKFGFDEKQYSSSMVLLGKKGPAILYGLP